MRAQRCICYRQVETITADNYTVEKVKEFVYFSQAVTTKNDVSLEIKRRITLGNSCYYGLNGQLTNRDLSHTTKLVLYKTLMLLVLLYDAEEWTLLCTDVAALSVLISCVCAGYAMSFVWRKMLRQGGYLMRESSEVDEEYDLVSVGRTK